jgi:hypothetical protein
VGLSRGVHGSVYLFSSPFSQSVGLSLAHTWREVLLSPSNEDEGVEEGGRKEAAQEREEGGHCEWTLVV